MSKRYGRNQKRKHRSEIARLEKSIEQKDAKIIGLINEADKNHRMYLDARSHALREFIKMNNLTYILVDAYAAILERFSGELRKPAQQILDSMTRNSRKPTTPHWIAEENFSISTETQVIEIRGRIPSSNYCIKVCNSKRNMLENSGYQV